MTDIASALEHECADASQTARASKIAELEKIADNGRGSLGVVPRAIAVPLMAVPIGMALSYVIHASAPTYPSTFFVGALFVVFIAWSWLYPHKPQFTLTEEGVRVKDVLLPWSSIEDFSVTEYRRNVSSGTVTQTHVVLRYVDGYTPPQLPLFCTLGQSKTWLRPQPTTVLKLHVGVKGMSNDKLSQRIGEFLAASRARAELARLRGEEDAAPSGNPRA